MLFPVSEVEASILKAQYAGKGGLAALTVKLRLPNGQMYDKTGTIDFSDISINSSTDTLDLRAVVPNPPRADIKSLGGNRTLVDGGFVTVILQSKNAEQQVTVPRAAVLADQQGGLRVRPRRREHGRSGATSLSATQPLSWPSWRPA